MMNRFKKRFVTELSISLVLIIALFSGVLFFLGQANDYTSKIASDRITLASRTNLVDKVAELRQQSQRASSYLNVLYNIVPPYDRLINLNKDFESLAAQNKVEYSFSFVGETPKSGGIGSIVFNLSVASTNLNSLISFVKSIQDFRYLSSIDNLSMKSNAEKLIMDIRGRIFYR